MGCTPVRSNKKEAKYQIPESKTDSIESEILGSSIALKYSFVKILGQGGMGKTYLAKDKAGDSYAIQKINKSRLGIENSKELCKNFSSLQSINSPYIVKYYELYEETHSIYLVMEYCSGGDLFDKLFASSKFIEPVSAKIIYMILQALAYLNKVGIVHCDIKPQNVMFSSPDPSATIKLIDFNLCKFSREGYDEYPNGTPQYLAPEIIDCRYSTKSDMWSLGIILHVCLTGEFPFWGDSHKILYSNIKEGKLRFEDEIWNGISTDAIDLTKKMLFVDEKKRITPEDAMLHPWFKNAHKYNKGISNEFRKNISFLNQYNKLHKALKKIINKHKWEDAQARVKELLTAEDGSQKVFLKVKDLEKIFFELNKKATLEEIHAVLKQYHQHDSDKLQVFHMLSSNERISMKEQIHSFGEIDLSRHSNQ